MYETFSVWNEFVSLTSLSRFEYSVDDSQCDKRHLMRQSLSGLFSLSVEYYESEELIFYQKRQHQIQ